jgi:hypothetical protein
MKGLISKVLTMAKDLLFAAMIVALALLLIGPQYIRWRVNRTLPPGKRIGFLAAHSRAGWLFREYRRNWPNSLLPTMVMCSPLVLIAAALLHPRM